MALATRRSYAGAAPACTLSSDIAAGATSFSVTGTTTNWPSTATGPFYMVIDPGLSTEEKVLVGARTSGSLSTVTRGVDGTTAASHVTGATCYPVFTAVDANDANLLASRLTAKGDLISSDGSDPTKVAVGANNTRLVADSAQTSGIKWVADTQNTVVDAKGDLLVGSAADTVARLAVGTDGHALVADSTATNGLNYAPLTGFKNAIINGDMSVSQRYGTTGVSFATGGGTQYFGTDRFHTIDYTWSAGTNPTVKQATPAGEGFAFPSGFSYAYKVNLGATPLTMASGGVFFVKTTVEGYNAARLYSGSATLSFWVRSSVTGTYTLFMANNDSGSSGRSVQYEYTISAANTWERKTILVDFASATSAGTWLRDNGLGVMIQWMLGANANRTGNQNVGTWGAFTNFTYNSASSVNWTSNANATFFLTGVQLEPGAVATPFEFRPFGTELALCQRYYFKVAATSASDYSAFGAGAAIASGYGTFYIKTPTTMRATPHTFDCSAASTFYIEAAAGAGNPTVITLYRANPDNYTVQVTKSGTTAGHGLAILQNSTNSSYLAASAEL